MTMVLHCQCCGTKVCEGAKYCYNCGAGEDSFQNGRKGRNTVSVRKKMATGAFTYNS